jgi:hypothetical protein
MEPFKTNVDFTDEELRVLNDVLRQTKITFSSEDALLMKLGRATHPILDLTHRIAVIFDNRVAESKKEPVPEAVKVSQ